MRYAAQRCCSCLAAVDGRPVVLDFGGLLQLLWQESGSELNFTTLVLQGEAVGLPR